MWLTPPPQIDEATQSILDQGIKAGLIEIRSDRIRYVSIGQSYDFSDPEERVRARVYVSLITKYGYPANRLDTEVIAPRRDPKLPADIVIYKDDRHNIPYAVIETKPTSSDQDILVAKREGLGNANLLRASFLVCVCGEEEIVFDASSSPSLKQLDECRIAQIPINYGLTPKYKYKRGADAPFCLEQANLNQLKTKFQRCHDVIWEGGKRDPATAFDEMSKLMLAKISDEIKETIVNDFYKFQIGTNESHSIVAERIKRLYKKAQKSEPEIFRSDIELPDALIYEIVSTLQDISLTETDLDAKGKAFEHFIGKYFRGDYGQFFTPRLIVQFMIDVVKPTEDDMVIDPACGSGGFLLYVLKAVRERIAKRFAGDPIAIRDNQKDFALKNIYGIEINDKIARIAMMDMVIHEDGHTNIEGGIDALIDPSGFDPRKQISLKKYTICLTNPPFGDDITPDKPYFKDYVFGGKLEEKRKGQKSEILFIERCLDLIDDDNGRLGIILPDSAISNIGNIEVVEHLSKTCKIKAIISLPHFTFTPFGSDAKTSILFLEKDKTALSRYEQKKLLQERIASIRADIQLSKDERKARIAKERELAHKYDYPIFMAYITKVGHDATGREDASYLGDTLDEIQKFQGNPVDYKGVYRDEGFWTAKVSFLDLSDKLDVEAYSWEYLKILNEIDTSNDDIEALGQIADIYSGWNASVSLQRTKGKIPLIKTADVKKIIQTKDNVSGETIGIVDWKRIDSFISIQEYNKRTEKQIRPNDILVQSVAHMRDYIADKIAIIDSIPKEFDGKAIALGKFLVVRVRDPKVNPIYLAMYLASPKGREQLVHYVRGMTAEIYERDIKDLLVILPDPIEQTKKGSKALGIVKELLDYESKVDDLKRKLLEI